MTLRVMTLCVASVVMTTNAVNAQTPILQYQFNETGTDAIDSGSALVNLPMTQWNPIGPAWDSADNHSAEGSGVSGAATDRAYHDPSVVYDDFTATGPPADLDHNYGGYAGGLNVTQVQSLAALTVQGWFKPPAGKMVGDSQGSYGALIGNLSNSSTDGGWIVRTQTSATAGTLELRYGEEVVSSDHRTVSSTLGVYSETDQWVFFAATLDAVTGDVQFFKGTSTTAVAAAGSGNMGSLGGGTIKLSNRSFYIGNSNSESSAYGRGRAFSGDLDNLRVFDSVLTSSQLDQIRQTDLLPPPLPPDGDYNHDNKVDAADYVLWRKDPTSFGGDPAGYNVWRANFGLPAGTGAGISADVVAEPSTTARGGLVFALIISVRRRK
jgi:hypothetical protein